MGHSTCCYLQTKVSFLVTGVVQEVIIDVSDSDISPLIDFSSKLSAQGVDISAVTKFDVPTGNGNDSAASSKLLAKTSAAFSDISAAG